VNAPNDQDVLPDEEQNRDLNYELAALAFRAPERAHTGGSGEPFFLIIGRKSVVFVSRFELAGTEYLPQLPQTFTEGPHAVLSKFRHAATARYFMMRPLLP
jgi:hypothetical protein